MWPASPLRLPVRPPRRATLPPETPSLLTPLSQCRWLSWDAPPHLGAGPPGIPYVLQGCRGSAPHPPSFQGCPTLPGPLCSPKLHSQAARPPRDPRSLRRHSPSRSLRAQGGSRALGRGERSQAQSAPCPQPWTVLWAPGRAGEWDTKAVALSRGCLDFEQQMELVAISANCRAGPGGGRGCPQPASTWKGGRRWTGISANFPRTPRVLPPPGTWRHEGDGVRTKAGGSHCRFPQAQRPYQPDPWRKSQFQVRGLCRLPGTKASCGGTEAWAAPGLRGVANSAWTILRL